MSAHAGNINWAATVATLSSPLASDEERRRARERAAAETMGAYPEPVAIPNPPAALARIRHDEEDDFDLWSQDERSAVKAYVREVTLAEERNHGSLLALLEAIAVLRASDDEVAIECAGELAKRVWRDYPGVRACLRGAQLPDTMAERRRLARAASRDYGRCRKAWRYA